MQVRNPFFSPVVICNGLAAPYLSRKQTNTHHWAPAATGHEDLAGCCKGGQWLLPPTPADLKSNSLFGQPLGWEVKSEHVSTALGKVPEKWMWLKRCFAAAVTIQISIWHLPVRPCSGSGLSWFVRCPKWHWNRWTLVQAAKTSCKSCCS